MKAELLEEPQVRITMGMDQAKALREFAGKVCVSRMATGIAGVGNGEKYDTAVALIRGCWLELHTSLDALLGD